MKFLGYDEVISRPEVAVTLNEVTTVKGREAVRLYNGDKIKVGLSNFCFEEGMCLGYINRDG